VFSSNCTSGYLIRNIYTLWRMWGIDFIVLSWLIKSSNRNSIQVVFLIDAFANAVNSVLASPLFRCSMYHLFGLRDGWNIS
jgi:hypothetical protein